MTLKQDKAAARFLIMLLSHLPCSQCGGWPNGFRARVFREKFADGQLRYRAFMSPSEYQEEGSRSFAMGPILDELAAIGLDLTTVHYDSRGLMTFGLAFQDPSVDIEFWLNVVLSEPVESLYAADTDAVEYSEIDISDLQNVPYESEALSQLLMEFVTSGGSDSRMGAQTATAILEALALASPGLVTVLSLRALLATAGYRSNSKMAALEFDDRMELFVWTLEQLLNNRQNNKCENVPVSYRKFVSQMPSST